MKEKKSTILKKLFFSTLYLSTFTFGGGYVIVTLLKNKFVDEYHWIDEEEMLDLVAIAQSSPWSHCRAQLLWWAISWELHLPGVLISVLGAILPPMILLPDFCDLLFLYLKSIYPCHVKRHDSRGWSCNYFSCI